MEKSNKRKLEYKSIRVGNCVGGSLLAQWWPIWDPMLSMCWTNNKRKQIFLGTSGIEPLACWLSSSHSAAELRTLSEKIKKELIFYEEENVILYFFRLINKTCFRFLFYFFLFSYCAFYWDTAQEYNPNTMPKLFVGSKEATVMIYVTLTFNA